MNTDTAANVQIAGEPVAWQAQFFFGSGHSGWGEWRELLPGEVEYAQIMAAAQPEKYQVRPLYTAASLAAITADRDRLREALMLAKKALENSGGILEGFAHTDANAEGAITEQMDENSKAIAAISAALESQ